MNVKCVLIGNSSVPIWIGTHQVEFLLNRGVEVFETDWIALSHQQEPKP